MTLCPICGELALHRQPEQDINPNWFNCPDCFFSWTMALQGVKTYWVEKRRDGKARWVVVPYGCLPVFNESYEQ